MTPTDDKPSAPTVARATRRDVVITGQFKRDMKREQKGRYRTTIQADLQQAVNLLAADHPLPAHMVDHPLGGNWKDRRDCHIKPDLVLIYRKSDPPSAKIHREAERPKLHLVRIGSHSELGF